MRFKWIDRTASDSKSPISKVSMWSLVEVAAGTDPTDATDNPAAYGDFVFIVPFEQPTLPPEDTLEFATSIEIADLYLLLDETGSMLYCSASRPKNSSDGLSRAIFQTFCAVR